MNNVQRERFNVFKIPITLPTLPPSSTCLVISVITHPLSFVLATQDSIFLIHTRHASSSGLSHILLPFVRNVAPWPYIWTDYPKTYFKYFLKYHLLQRPSLLSFVTLQYASIFPIPSPTLFFLHINLHFPTQYILSIVVSYHWIIWYMRYGL